MASEKLNRPGAPANQSQHIPGDYGDSGKPSDAQNPATNPNKRSGNANNSDPHPATEEGHGRDSKVPLSGL